MAAAGCLGGWKPEWELAELFGDLAGTMVAVVVDAVVGVVPAVDGGHHLLAGMAALAAQITLLLLAMMEEMKGALIWLHWEER